MPGSIHYVSISSVFMDLLVVCRSHAPIVRIPFASRSMLCSSFFSPTLLPTPSSSRTDVRDNGPPTLLLVLKLTISVISFLSLLLLTLLTVPYSVLSAFLPFSSLAALQEQTTQAMGHRRYYWRQKLAVSACCAAGVAAAQGEQAHQAQAQA